MKKFKLYLSILVVLFVAYGCGSEQKPKIQEKKEIVTITALGTTNEWQKVPVLKTWTEANSYCKELGDGWRLPKSREFFALLDNDKSIDAHFPQASNIKEFWSATKTAFDETKAWKITAWSSSEFYADINNSLGVRCIRGEELPAHTFVTEDENIKVSNPKTGQEILWQNSTSPQELMTWQEAKTHCETKSLRLPTIFELQNIISKDGKTNKLFEDNKITNFTAIWSITPLVTNSNQALNINMETGGVSFNNKTAQNYVRCVQTVNHKPTAFSQSVEVPEDGSVDITLKGKDSDGDDLTFEVSMASNGTLTLNENIATYMPNPNYNGVDNFTFKVNDGDLDSESVTINITVNPINDAPIILDIQPIVIEEDSVINEAIKASDDDHNLLTFSTIAIDGFSLDATGTYTFDTTNSSYQDIKEAEEREIIIPITVSDTLLTDTKDLTIKIIGKNDTPIAINDFNQTNEDNTVSFNILSNDTDIDNNSTLTLLEVNTTDASVTFEQNGSITFSPIGYFDYLAQNEELNVSLTYKMQDEYNLTSEANITITIIGINDITIVDEIAPLDLNLSTNSKITGYVTAFDNDNNFTFSSDTNTSGNFDINSTTGAYTFRPINTAYKRLKKGQAKEVNIPIFVNGIERKLNITVIGKNDAPIAHNDNVTTDEESDKVIHVLNNDTDIDNDFTLSIVSVDMLTQGTAFINGTNIEFIVGNSFEYLKDNEEINVTFSYTIQDEYNATSEANITVTVFGFNTAPIANAGEDKNVTVGESVTFSAFGSKDVDGEIVSYEWRDEKGILSNDMNFTKTATPDSVGIHTLMLKVTDDNGSVATDEIVINITSSSLRLPKTGASSIAIYDDGYYKRGQDGNFSKIGETVLDSSTGLMWQDDSFVNIEQNWTEANNSCNDMDLNGYNDWRLPNFHELYFLARKDTILDKNFNQLSIISTIGYNYWSSSKSFGNVSVVDFQNAREFKKDINTSNYARCVRGEELTFNFTRDNTNEVVIDTQHKLMWDDRNISMSKDWTEAIEYCEGLTTASHDDWRLPNIYELYSIIDTSRQYPATNEVFMNTLYGFYWSSTKFLTNFDEVYVVNFMDQRDEPNVLTSIQNVRCVRDIP